MQTPFRSSPGAALISYFLWEWNILALFLELPGVTAGKAKLDQSWGVSHGLSFSPTEDQHRGSSL